MAEWQKYISHKVVKAMPITSIAGHEVHVGPDQEIFHPTEPAMKARAEVGGYAIIYPDGFRSVSPKKAFEDGYTPLVDHEAISLTYWKE